MLRVDDWMQWRFVGGVGAAAAFTHCCLNSDYLRGVVLRNVCNWALPSLKKRVFLLK
jgi:hypothetical protein